MVLLLWTTNTCVTPAEPQTLCICSSMQLNSYALAKLLLHWELKIHFFPFLISVQCFFDYDNFESSDSKGQTHLPVP